MTQSLAAAAVASVGTGQTHTVSARPHLELRRYSLLTGTQPLKVLETYFADALIPALNRVGIGPVGVFKVTIGPETPTFYVLLPCASLDTLVNVEAALAHDAIFRSAAAPFLKAPAERLAFRRVDSSLLASFEDFSLPLTQRAPAGDAASRKHLFQLRIYESPTSDAHEKKIAMFQQAELDLFKAAGMQYVFFGRTLVGQNLPNLQYMLAFKDMAELEAQWKAFSTSPAWRKLVTAPGNSDDFLISNITNLMLAPTAYSQI